MAASFYNTSFLMAYLRPAHSAQRSAGPPRYDSNVWHSWAPRHPFMTSYWQLMSSNVSLSPHDLLNRNCTYHFNLNPPFALLLLYNPKYDDLHTDSALQTSIMRYVLTLNDRPPPTKAPPTRNTTNHHHQHHQATPNNRQPNPTRPSLLQKPTSKPHHPRYPHPHRLKPTNPPPSLIPTSPTPTPPPPPPANPHSYPPHPSSSNFPTSPNLARTYHPIYPSLSL